MTTHKLTPQEIDDLRTKTLEFLTAPYGIKEICDHLGGLEQNQVRTYVISPLVLDGKLVKYGDKRSTRYAAAGVDCSGLLTNQVDRQQLTEEVVEYFRNQNQRTVSMKDISTKLDKDMSELRPVIKNLINDNVLFSEGNRRSCRYGLVGATNKTSVSVSVNSGNTEQSETENNTDNANENKPLTSEIFQSLLDGNKEYQIEDVRRLILEHNRNANQTMVNDLIFNSARQGILRHEMRHTEHGARMFYRLSDDAST